MNKNFEMALHFYESWKDLNARKPIIEFKTSSSSSSFPIPVLAFFVFQFSPYFQPLHFPGSKHSRCFSNLAMESKEKQPKAEKFTSSVSPSLIRYQRFKQKKKEKKNWKKGGNRVEKGTNLEEIVWNPWERRGCEI